MRIFLLPGALAAVIACGGSSAKPDGASDTPAASNFSFFITSRESAGR